MTDTSASFSFPDAAERRAFRDEIGRGIGRYIPPELRPLLGLVAESTPSASLERAGEASMRMVAPDRTASERIGDFGSMLSETAGVAAPVAATRFGVPVAEAAQEVFMGASAPMRSAADTFFERMNQPGEVPVMYSGFDPLAAFRAAREAVLGASNETPFEDLVELSSRQSAARDAAVEALSGARNVRLFDSQGRGVVVGEGMGPGEDGKFRVTYFNADQRPTNHTVYDTREEALNAALQEGFTLPTAARESSEFDPEAMIRSLREGVPAAEARLADDMRIGNERIRAESLARTGEIPSVTPPERYAEFLNQRGFDPDFQELILGPMGDRFDTVRHIFDEDIDFALDSLRNVAGDMAGPRQLASTRSQVTRLTQELLQDFPDEITVYRAGPVVPGRPQSFTLDPNYDVSGNLPWRRGTDAPLEAYTVRKSDILASPDITRRGAIGEGEVIIRGDNVSRIADPGSEVPPTTFQSSAQGAAVRPQLGEPFDDWIDRIYAPENRGPENRVQDPNVVFRAMSPEEASFGEAEGVFRDVSGAPLYVANDPERYIGGGAYGGRNRGRIYEFDVTDIPSETRAGGVGITERAVSEIPAERVRRIWEWNPDRRAHVLIEDRTAAPRAADPGSPTPFLYGTNSREEELRELLRRIDARERARINAEAQRDIDRVAGSSSNTPQDFGYYQDNPALKFSNGQEWLEDKQRSAELNYDERRGITGSITGTLGTREQDMFLPTRFLRRIPGLQNERRVPGDPQYDRLMQDAQERGFLPDQGDNKIVLGINHRGEPFIIEGNTRTAVASDLGIPNVRVEVRYWNGGEMVDGPFSPENISRIAARGPENFAKGGAVMMRSNIPKQVEGGIGGLNQRARDMYRGPRGIGRFASYMADGGEVMPSEVLPTTGVGRGSMRGSTLGSPVSGPAAGRDESASDRRLEAVRRRVMEESGVDPVQVAMDEGVDPDLFLRLIVQESSGNSRAESDAGAYGYTQLMEGTARELGVDRTNPRENLIGGARYLRQQLDRFQDVPLALAAYNAGPGAVERFGGVPPYAETRTYIARILGNEGGQMGISPGRRPDPVVPRMRPDPALAAAPAPTMRPDLLPAMDPATAYRQQQQQLLMQTMANAPQVASSRQVAPMAPEAMRMQLAPQQPQQAAGPQDRGFVDIMRSMP